MSDPIRFVENYAIGWETRQREMSYEELEDLYGPGEDTPVMALIRRCQQLGGALAERDQRLAALTDLVTEALGYVGTKPYQDWQDRAREALAGRQEGATK